ncbi:hypothetical protein FNH05_22150 [Amycolatopsis rhizosphaerae]|uniref:Uncharacterized protein n=1 Tax=Amycolatopsis rhizosphaerae TaxID=2053003 RepID=A0A558C561_9PSEU|nr:hypothetical protein [Amycolatopsis rhizosphaerae]TVT43827.1 hypothetical protein FNH05_22150 [Amycolatopsis rhizosphaerae]
MNPFVLMGLVVFGPPSAYGLLSLVRARWLRRQPEPGEMKITVAQLAARLAQERTGVYEATDQLRQRERGLLPGWHWPSRDPDFNRAVSTSLRARPYVQQAALGDRQGKKIELSIASHDVYRRSAREGTD